MPIQNRKEKIIIIDFGSQVTKLIARRIRDLGVYSEILTINSLKDLKDLNGVKGIILSGGPSTVTKKKYPTLPKKIFLQKIPILGICYGLQLIAKLNKGLIKSQRKKREFGRAKLIKKKESLLIANFFKKNKENFVWMSHQDVVSKIPNGFKTIASTTESKFTVIENSKKKLYGVQFHPEVTHTTNGIEIFSNFLFKICKVKKNGMQTSKQKD